MSNFLKDGERRRKMPDGSFVTIDRNGNIVADDGEVVSVPMWMMDSKQSLRTAAESTSAPDAAYHFIDGKFVPVPPRIDDDDDDRVPTFDASSHRPHQIAMTDSDNARAVASHHKMVQRLNDAWKKPAPTVSDSVKTVLRRGAKETAAPSAEAKDAHDRYRQRVENEWRQPKPTI